MTPDSKLVSRFDLSRSYNKRPSWAKIRGVIIHTAELGELDDAAERLGHWTKTSAHVSWHYAVDNNSIVQSVPEADRSWTGGPSNDEFIHIELAGYARQTDEQWSDEYSIDMLDLCAQLVADITDRHQIPVNRLTPRHLLQGYSGLAGHVDVSDAVTMARREGHKERPWFMNGKWRRSNHRDPGPNFPWQRFLNGIGTYSTRSYADMTGMKV